MYYTMIEDYFAEDMLMAPPARRVIQWHPQQGSSDDMLSVTLEQKMTRVPPTMKLMFGMTTVETTQQQQWVPSSFEDNDGEPRLWITLCARVPPPSASMQQLDAGQVPLSIAIYDDNDNHQQPQQWAFGTFTYLVKDSSPTSTTSATAANNSSSGFAGNACNCICILDPLCNANIHIVIDNYQLLQLLAPYSQEMPTPPHTPASVTNAGGAHGTNNNAYHHPMQQQQYHPTTNAMSLHQGMPPATPSSSSSSSSTTSHHYYYTTQSIAGVLNKAHLRICGELNEMTTNWTPQEWAAGRRLVQFTRRADGETLDGHTQIACSFKPMDQQEHHQQRMRENMAAAAAAAAVAAAAAAAGQQQHHQGLGQGYPTTTTTAPPPHPPPYHHQQNGGNGNNTSLVVSCIYWRDRNDYFITSVDCIYLLEGLIGVQFTVEEKNRIRRNLEGFRPLTVSKCKPDCAEFFKLIMGFPHPKPRNIEKDVKVFSWKTLPHALRKIIRKYTPSYSSTNASANGLGHHSTATCMPSTTTTNAGGPQRHQHHHHYTHHPTSSSMGYM